MPPRDPENDKQPTHDADNGASGTGPAQDLTSEISAESQESVQEFLGEAAQQNQEANAELGGGGEDAGRRTADSAAEQPPNPEPYISFEHVYK